MKPPADLSQIEALFHAALEREPAERAAFLAEACADDPGMLGAVNDLLAARDQSWSLMDRRQVASEFDSASDSTKHLPNAAAPQAVPNPAPHSLGVGQRGGRFVAGAMLA